MYEWMDVWKNLFIYVVVCVLMGLGWFRYGFADVLKNMSAGLPNLWDTARHSPSSCCCRRTCCWASWLESSAKASNNHQSSTITPATTLSTSIAPMRQESLNICNILQPGLQLLWDLRLFPQVPLIVVRFCCFCCSCLNCARYLRFQESHRLEQESRTLKGSEEQNNCSQ